MSKTFTELKIANKELRIYYSGDSLNTYDLSEFPYLGNSAAWTSEDDEDVEKDSSKDYSEKPSEPRKSSGQKTIGI